MTTHLDDPPVPLESPPCVLCGGDQFDVVYDDARDWFFLKPGRFTVSRCRGCSLMATRPRPTAEGLGFYYEDTYRHIFRSQAQLHAPVLRWIPRYRLRTLLKARSLGPADRVLDVGCGYGAFLKAVRDATGAQAVGVDQDPSNVERAADRDVITYRLGRFEELELGNGTFSAVTFIECLEHMPDPVAALRRAHELLAPGGVVMVEVPNFRSWWRVLFRTTWMPLLVPQHLHHFTPETLARVSQEAGFQTVRQQSMMFPGEPTASLALWVRRVLRLPPRAQRQGWQELAGLASFLACALVAVTIDMPVQFILRLLGRSGTQVLLGRKPPAP